MKHLRKTASGLQLHCLRGQFNSEVLDLKKEEIYFQEMSYTP